MKGGSALTFDLGGKYRDNLKSEKASLREEAKYAKQTAARIARDLKAQERAAAKETRWYEKQQRQAEAAETRAQLDYAKNNAARLARDAKAEEREAKAAAKSSAKAKKEFDRDDARIVKHRDQAEPDRSRPRTSNEEGWARGGLGSGGSDTWGDFFKRS